jgi:serine/threonine protein phosphatase PrpC
MDHSTRSIPQGAATSAGAGADASALKTLASGQVCLQLDKKQDFATSGEIDGYWYGVVADGHGKTGRVISCLRDLNWNEVMRRPRPIEYIQERILTLGETRRDGSTITIAKVIGKAIRVTWLGDSSAIAFRNGRCCWKSVDHSTNNTEELSATKRRGCRVREGGWDLDAISPTIMTMVPKPRISLGPYGDGEELLSMTRCLGHNSHLEGGNLDTLAGTDPTSHTIHFSKGEHARLILASDGLWDVMSDIDTSWLSNRSTTAEFIAQKAQDRWAQEWTYRRPDSKNRGTWSPRDSRTKIPKPDDVAVVVWNGQIK